ncbi:MAG: aspartate/tyrosine/aromatic aminotransferase [Cardiobacteriaceae bacterium]|nr:aspartate/tyrosine/aromatic aminotransferase [Cardiobacteriaceae bacterium]
MFKNVQQLPADPILQLTQLCRDDKREEKIDVGVGIFINADGETPVLRAVKEAEKRLLATQTTKKYQPLSGNPEYNEAIAKLVLADSFDSNRIRVNQSTGGTGALRVIGEAINSMQPNGKFWIPDPTWGNHLAIFAAAGLKIERYKYLDEKTSEVDKNSVFAALEKLGEEDCVLLHGCCHNPSGADFSRDDWVKITELANKNGFTPVIDFAYLGLGESIEDDAWGVRYVVKNVAQALVAVSCSKNFGLYRDRAGAILTLGANSAEAGAMQSHINAETRKVVSMAPDHPASVVAEILNDAALRKDWETELNEMCAFIRTRREKLQAALQAKSSFDWSFVTRHHGMFSLLPLGVERVKKLREDFAIYMVGTGRINLAGLRSDEKIAYFADSVAKVM